MKFEFLKSKGDESFRYLRTYPLTPLVYPQDIAEIAFTIDHVLDANAASPDQLSGQSDS